MKEFLLHLFEEHAQLAVLFSILVSIFIAVAGVVPIFFITAANILFFGFWQGTFVSFLGEAIGAAVAFLLYRKGFKYSSGKKLQQFAQLQRLLNTKGREAFFLVISLRLLPFVPSGLVTFAAAIGEISFLNFLIASSVGKAPALLIEAYSVFEITKFRWQGKLILFVAALFFLYLAIKRLREQKR